MAYGFYKTARLVHWMNKDDKTPVDKWQLLRGVAHDTCSFPAQLKLEWIIFYYTAGGEDATKTASHFGISRKTFHKWMSRFNERNLKSLEEHDRAPVHRRAWQVTRAEEDRIIALRKTYLKYGKKETQGPL